MGGEPYRDPPAPPAKRWFRRARPADALIGSTRVCPSCHVTGPIRLTAGQLCTACEARDAWAATGGRLVIDHGEIDAALRRREGEAAGAPIHHRAAAWLPPAITLTAAALSLWALLHMLRPRSLGPLIALFSELRSSAFHAMLAGGATLVLAIAALIRMRKRRRHRHLPVIATHVVALVIGGIALSVGGLDWLSRGGFNTHYAAMPPRAPADGLATERVYDATAVILAPGGDGDARELGLGTGTVIAGDSGRAWIVTCSHVAMPYAAVASWRDPKTAQPVWVQLADGREGQGAVRWTAPPPLDVALIELPIANPPAPVPIAVDASSLAEGASVSFVPNPYRDGWLAHHGTLIKRETHHTPAGTYDLLYTDLPVTFGDSGSGLFDATGQLVGLNTWTRIGTGASQGISLPSETMRALVDAIKSNKLDQLRSATR